MDYTLSRELRKSLSISEEIKRRKEGDALLNFELNPGGQTAFTASVLDGKMRENWFLAANRAGKSDAGAYADAMLARFGDQSPDKRYIKGAGSDISVRDRAVSLWVVSLDFPSSRDIIQPKIFDNGFMPPGSTHEPFIPAHEYNNKDWRVSDQILKLKNGSIIGFKSADSGRSKFQGTEKDAVHFDEEPPEGIYEECVIRVGRRKLRVFGTCTLLPPEGQVGGVTWVFQKKVKPWQAGTLEGCGIFNASIYENPHINREEITALEAIYPEGSLMRKIRLEGQLIGGVGGSRIYSGFDARLNVREQPSLHLRRPLCWIWDFNVEPMVTLVGQRTQKLFRVYKELHLDEGNIAEMCDMFKRYFPFHMAEIHIYGDATGKERSHQTKMSSYQIILNNMMDYPAPLKMKVPESNPAVTMRINSMNRAFKDEQGEVCLEIDPECQETIDDFDQVISDGKGGIKKTFNRRDPYFKRTHASDALGYWVFSEAPVKPIQQQGQHKEVRTIPTPGYAHAS